MSNGNWHPYCKVLPNTVSLINNEHAVVAIWQLVPNTWEIVHKQLKFCQILCHGVLFHFLCNFTLLDRTVKDGARKAVGDRYGVGLENDDSNMQVLCGGLRVQCHSAPLPHSVPCFTIFGKQKTVEAVPPWPLLPVLQLTETLFSWYSSASSALQMYGLNTTMTLPIAPTSTVHTHRHGKYTCLCLEANLISYWSEAEWYR